MKNGRESLRVIEIALSGLAIVLLGVYAVAGIDRWTSEKAALRAFEAAKANIRSREEQGRSSFTSPDRLDFSLWSEKRVGAYKQTLLQASSAIAVLTVPRFGIRAPVLKGTDEFALNRGVGWIEGTARPGQRGNIGMAGHRDGFFRALKDIAMGDEIGLEVMSGFMRYKVDLVEIVTPDDVSVLRERQPESITLVTCYPFYFIGDAPQRFIVHAVRQYDPAAGRTEGDSASATLSKEKEE